MNVAATEREHRFRLCDGRTIACLSFGHPTGRPIIYLHGYPGSRFEGRLAARAAEQLDAWLIAPDRPGFGESTFQPGRTIGSWPSDVVELADQLCLDRFAVIGVSGGGPYALACAARIPERIDGITLVGALGPVLPGRLPRTMTTPNRLVLALAGRWPSLARLGARVAAHWVRRHATFYIDTMAAGAPPADRAVLVDANYRTLVAESVAAALRKGGQGAAWELTLLAQPWDFRLRDVVVPVQLWHGVADTIVPVSMARELSGGLADCESHYLPGEGHLSLIVNYLDAVIVDLCR